MDKDYWINLLKENEMENMMVLSSILNQESVEHIFDNISDDTIIATYDFGFVKRGSFFSSDLNHSIKNIAQWLHMQGVEVETTFDNMILLYSALGNKNIPSRYYLLRYSCRKDVMIDKHLDYEIVDPLLKYADFLREGVEDIYKLSRNELNRLFNNSAFIKDMSKGIYIFKKDGIPVGYVMAKYISENFVEISNLWIKKNYRGKGYSNEIIKTLINIYKEVDKCLLVTVKKDNFGLIRLFEDENFELVKIMSREKL
ncbi:MAG: GNAT family N-acetyltransferase [Clostridiales bacterium]|nr:GNAT family N-acetyltransferase [Clostridiales bacterium]